MPELLDDLARYFAEFLATIAFVCIVVTAMALWLVAFPVGLLANLMRPIPAARAWRETVEIFCPWMESRRG